jgi:hypothetical protein
MTYSKKEQMNKLLVLRQRTERWKQMYMMNSDRDQFEKDLTIIENCIDSLEKQKRASLATGIGYPLMKVLMRFGIDIKLTKR